MFPFNSQKINLPLLITLEIELMIKSSNTALKEKKLGRLKQEWESRGVFINKFHLNYSNLIKTEFAKSSLPPSK